MYDSLRLTGATVHPVMSGDGIRYEVTTLGPGGWAVDDPRVSVSDWGISE